jgi:vancomycin resistance protein YoaR
MPTILGFDSKSLAAELAAFAERGYRQPRDAGVTSTREALTISGAVDGVQVDATGIVPAISAALLDPASPAALTFTADSARVAPAISDADARRAYRDAERIATKLVLTHGKQKWEIQAARIRMWITFTGEGAAYAPKLDSAGVPAVVKRFAKDLHRAPTESRLLRTRAGGVFGVTASRLGRALDVKATATRVVAALAARTDGSDPGARVKVQTMEVAPKLSTDEATKKAPLVLQMGSWTTRYQASARNGFAANIMVPARRLDGMVVRPGQVFEFWGALGEVSFRTGYRLGAAIVGGRTVQGRALAGGICSVSTTLFNAAARAGLEIVTRSAHWYYIDRYPLGLDATVSGSQSMRFRNDTKHPILIKAYASSGTVRFEIWSVPNDRTVSWSAPSVSNVERGYDTVQDTSALPRGKRERIEWPVDGKNVSVTRTVRNAAGAVLHRDVFISRYHRMVGVTLVGTG